MDSFLLLKISLFHFSISRLHNMAADNILFFFIIKRQKKRETDEKNRVRPNNSNRKTEFPLDLNLVHREGTLSSSHKGPSTWLGWWWGQRHCIKGDPRVHLVDWNRVITKIVIIESFINNYPPRMLALEL